MSILIQLGGYQSPVVHGDMITEGGGFTMLTMRGRSGARDKDAQSLILMDNRGGWMMAYELTGSKPNRSIELLDGGQMEALFERVDSCPHRLLDPEPIRSIRSDINPEPDVH